MKGKMKATSDNLVFRTSAGAVCSWSAEQIAAGLVSKPGLHMSVLREAAELADHHYRVYLRRFEVTVEEFSATLRTILTKMGCRVVKEAHTELYYAPTARLDRGNPLGAYLASRQKPFIFPQTEEDTINVSVSSSITPQMVKDTALALREHYRKEGRNEEIPTMEFQQDLQTILDAMKVA